MVIERVSRLIRIDEIISATEIRGYVVDREHATVQERHVYSQITAQRIKKHYASQKSGSAKSYIEVIAE